MVNKMVKKIGVTLDFETTETYAKYPWYALRANYTTAVESMGAIAYPLSHNIDAIEEYASYLDAIIITGGNFDIAPEYYGKMKEHDLIIKDTRTKFELALFKKFYELDKPILGICGGEQLINVALGGSLMQHIPDEIEDALVHEQKTPKHLPSHEAEVLDISMLYKIVGQDKIQVNSTHHQAVKDLGQNLVISAIAPDGVIEAIEDVTRKFCIGVQWHPEYLHTESDKKLFASFLDAIDL